MSGQSLVRRVDRRVGEGARAAGIILAAASVAFFLASFVYPSIVLQINSVVSFSVAIVLLVRDPRPRAQTRVLDSLMNSANASLAQLSSMSGSDFVYRQGGATVSEVTVEAAGPPTTGPGRAANGAKLIPPGRTLAELIAREGGAKALTADYLEGGLGPILTDGYGLAESVKVVVGKTRVTVTLVSPAVACTSSESGGAGVLGCPVSSAVAVLFAAATKTGVSLRPCARGPASDTWTIVMDLEEPPA